MKKLGKKQNRDYQEDLDTQMYQVQSVNVRQF